MAQESLIQAVDLRIQQNLPLIHEVLGTFRDALREDLDSMNSEFTRMTGLQKPNRFNRFDPDLLALSEMGLCEALDFSFRLVGVFDGLPLNVQRGSVRFNRGDKELRTDHFYFRADTSPVFVASLLPAQFIDHGRFPQYKGQKIDDLVARAPMLARRFSDEIAVLRGSVDDIQGQLGLSYLDQPKD